MTPSYSLAHLTTEGLAPPDMLEVAARAGYDYAGIRLLPAAPGGVAYPLMDDAALLRATKARVAETGVGIFDLEMIRLDEQFDVQRYQPFFEVGAELGASAILVAGADPDRGRLADSYAALCDAAHPFGLTCDLEFMPWTDVPDVTSALEVVAQADAANGGILVDALHYARSGSRVEQVDRIAGQWLHYAQICDGPANGPNSVEGLIHAARCDRWLPGEGGIDLLGLWQHLPADLPVSIEIPNKKRVMEAGYEAWARSALDASRALVSGLPDKD